jgi:hypothetical protein
MSQTFFSKQDVIETRSRLALLGQSRGLVTIWIKGNKDKHSYSSLQFDKERMELVLNTMAIHFKEGEQVLCAFDLRGMNFFAECTFQLAIDGHAVLLFKEHIFKSERRTSYRLMTYPLYEVWSVFDLPDVYGGGKVVDLKTGHSQTGLFKSFLSIVEGDEAAGDGQLKIRIQDLSTTGMALHVGEQEIVYFKKDTVFGNVVIRFSDEDIVIPKAKIVYVVDYISKDKNIKKYKLGVHFEELPMTIDERIGKKINELLRLNDHNKDFENFLK